MTNLSIETNELITKKQLKETLKEIILEIVAENKQEFSDLMIEILEDIALSKAIKEGEETELVDRESIFSILENR